MAKMRRKKREGGVGVANVLCVYVVSTLPLDRPGVSLSWKDITEREETRTLHSGILPSFVGFWLSRPNGEEAKWRGEGDMQQKATVTGYDIQTKGLGKKTSRQKKKKMSIL
ncbi:hypothetical protein B9Z55_027545 [Caenorhabditis nigoni]|uniref:Uncharacterized protein n=1 Tax=Caenorhabditis nigoni TaxID=1611254 RepID=A0A2G5SF30_9PELO|nr:hypothetical protein B9Z55_027545 [Caenorhabditis nigoni]